MGHKLKIGDRFGYLELIEPIRYRRRIAWKCKCVCGKIVTRVESYLRNVVRDRINSCGCENPVMKQKGVHHPQWKGIGSMPMQYINTLQFRASQHNLEFNVTIDELWCKYLEQGGFCALTKLPIHFCPRRQQKNGKEQTASLDRKDSNKGYTIENVQWVHKKINKMKNDLSESEFVQMCNLVTLNSNRG